MAMNPVLHGNRDIGTDSRTAFSIYLQGNIKSKFVNKVQPDEFEMCFFIDVHTVEIS